MTTGNSATDDVDRAGATWRKSSYSGQANNCVEIAHVDGTTYVRDTKHASVGPVLAFTAAEWEAFLAGARDGEFDRPTHP